MACRMPARRVALPPDQRLDQRLDQQPDQQPDELPGPEICLAFPADPFSVRVALEGVVSDASVRRLTADDQSSLELVLAEVLNNIVEHAYATASVSGSIELRLRVQHGALQCDVVDHGQPMPNGQPPGGRPSDSTVPLEDLPEGGFGWYLIHTLTRNLTYRRDGIQNRLSFHLPLQASDPTPEGRQIGLYFNA